MSSGSESDEEYVPGEPEQVSEEGSADEETDLQYEKEQEIKTIKRKASEESKSKKKRRTRNNEKEPTPEPEEKEPETNLDPVEEKKREEDLWAKFLAGTGGNTVKPKAATKESPVSQPEKAVSEKAKPQATTSNDDDIKAREKRIFQFAGETIVVENNIIKEKVKTAESSATVSKIIPQRSRGSSGLADVLGQINKKNQLSTLEKSKLDWETFKKDQDINDEIQNHNKGKNGYLDRQDFLERADHRQYEIERDMRLNRRSNR